mmetsp:Transcript_3025/g.6450  ORF Transcript_3025/g.6450 Transcript_3025/m.6450 type:complete len:237 (+) Transcript_3025:1260-1970(+)
MAAVVHTHHGGLLGRSSAGRWWLHRVKACQSCSWQGCRYHLGQGGGRSSGALLHRATGDNEIEESIGVDEILNWELSVDVDIQDDRSQEARHRESKGSATILCVARGRPNHRSRQASHRDCQDANREAHDGHHAVIPWAHLRQLVAMGNGLAEVDVAVLIVDLQLGLEFGFQLYDAGRGLVSDVAPLFWRVPDRLVRSCQQGDGDANVIAHRLQALRIGRLGVHFVWGSLTQVLAK